MTKIVAEWIGMVGAMWLIEAALIVGLAPLGGIGLLLYRALRNATALERKL